MDGLSPHEEMLETMKVKKLKEHILEESIVMAAAVGSVALTTEEIAIINAQLEGKNSTQLRKILEQTGKTDKEVKAEMITKLINQVKIDNPDLESNYINNLEDKYNAMSLTDLKLADAAAAAGGSRKRKARKSKKRKSRKRKAKKSKKRKSAKRRRTR